jgi:ABC-type Zn2+ transport system substrate-binding protein/surface adhesin
VISPAAVVVKKLCVVLCCGATAFDNCTDDEDEAHDHDEDHDQDHSGDDHDCCCWWRGAMVVTFSFSVAGWLVGRSQLLWSVKVCVYPTSSVCHD